MHKMVSRIGAVTIIILPQFYIDSTNHQLSWPKAIGFGDGRDACWQRDSGLCAWREIVKMMHKCRNEGLYCYVTVGTDAPFRCVGNISAKGLVISIGTACLCSKAFIPITCSPRFLSDVTDCFCRRLPKTRP